MQIANDSQCGRWLAITHPRTQTDSIQVVQVIQAMSKSWIKIAQRSPPHSPQPADEEEEEREGDDNIDDKKEAESPPASVT